MALAPLIPEEASFGVGLFLAFVAFLFLIALRAAYQMTLGLAFSTIARLIRALPSISLGFTRIGFGFLAAPFEAIDNTIYHGIGVGISQTEHAWHKLILWNAYVLAKTGDEIAAVTYDVLAALHIVHAKVSPAAIQAATRPFIQNYVTTLPPFKVATKPQARQAADGFASLAARVAKLEREAATAGTHSIAIPYPVPLPRAGEEAKPASGTVVIPAPRTGELADGLKWARGEIGKLKRAATVAGIVGLVAAALTRLGLGRLSCSNVKRTLPHLCGMNTSLLESLLADTLLIAGTVSLVEFARGMQGIVAEVEGPIRTFWRAT